MRSPFLLMASLYQRYSLELVVFVSGALVMVFEIIGSRILSPFIGSSTYIWTSLIGVILACLSLGYWIGGRLADRRPDPRILALTMFSAGALVAVTVLLKDILLSWIAAAPAMIEIKALAASLLLFGPASVCFGIVTPYAVRLRMTSLDQSGRTVGRLYALSTVGSIIGTFAAGFLLIPFVGSVRTLYLISAAAMALSLLIAPLALSKAKIAAVTVLFLGVAASEANSYLLRHANGLYDLDTEYSRVQIFNTTDPRSGRPIRALATDPFFVQSARFLDSDELVLEYSNFYHQAGHFRPDLDRTLLIGGAGYSFPKSYLKTYPQARIDVVEIDPGMTEIARRHFGLVSDERLTITHEDGRMFINTAASGTYDAVLMDAFGSLFSVPHHLTTVEAVRELHRVLNDDGLVIFNLGAAISGDASGFLRAELSTYKAVFPQVLLFKVNPEYPDEKLQNLVIVALKRPAGSPGAADEKVRSMLARLYDTGGIHAGQILTDDLAPVEHFNSIAQNVYLSER